MSTQRTVIGYFLSDAEGRALGPATGDGIDTYASDWLGGVTDVIGPQGSMLESYDFDPFVCRASTARPAQPSPATNTDPDPGLVAPPVIR